MFSSHMHQWIADNNFNNLVEYFSEIRRNRRNVLNIVINIFGYPGCFWLQFACILYRILYIIYVNAQYITCFHMNFIIKWLLMKFLRITPSSSYFRNDRTWYEGEIWFLNRKYYQSRQKSRSTRLAIERILSHIYRKYSQ